MSDFTYLNAAFQSFTENAKKRDKNIRANKFMFIINKMLEE